MHAAKQPKLINVMIVDDEILAIRHLKNLIDWEASGFTVAAEAVTAAQALELAEKTAPQLIFMDIRMPAMDGLEVSRRILAGRRRTRIVLLTSYRDFEYAKSALEIGVSGYLLKHETNAELLRRELAKYKQELEREEREERLALRQQLRDALERGDTEGRPLQALEEKTAAGKETFVLLGVKPDAPYPVIMREREAARRSDSAAGLQAKRPPAGPDPEMDPPLSLQDIQGLTFIESVFIDEMQVLLFRAPSLPGEYAFRSASHAAAASIRDSMKTVSVLVSAPFKSMAELPAVYRKMERAAAALVLYGKGAIVHLLDLRLPEQPDPGTWHDLAHMFRADSQPPTPQAFLAALDEALERIGGPDRFHPALFRFICQNAIRWLERMRERKGLPSYAELMAAEELDEGAWHSVADIRGWFAREADSIAASPAPDVHSSKVRRALQYIHAHYAEDLTCETIGEALQISGDYLRKVFKEETGRTVADYVTGCRIGRAKEMLRSGRYKIYEVSDAVGYRSSQYFSQVFKKWTGLTPQQYMESGDRTP